MQQHADWVRFLEPSQGRDSCGTRGDIKDLGWRIKGNVDRVISCEGALRGDVLFGVAVAEKASSGHGRTEILLEKLEHEYVDHRIR